MEIQMIDKVPVETVVEMAELKSKLKPTREDYETRVSLMLGYVKAHEGEEIQGKDFAQVAGYSSPITANIAVKKLVNQRRLIRERLKGAGMGQHYTYYLGNTSAQGHKNGPAIATPAHAVPVVPEAMIGRASVLPPRLDSLIWRFLKQVVIEPQREDATYELGLTTRILQDFSKFVEQQQFDNHNRDEVR